MNYFIREVGGGSPEIIAEEASSMEHVSVFSVVVSKVCSSWLDCPQVARSFWRVI